MSSGHEKATPRRWAHAPFANQIYTCHGAVVVADVEREADALLIVEAVNSYDTLRAERARLAEENARLRADRLVLYVWMRHVDWSDCDVSKWLNNKPIALCIPSSKEGHDAADRLYRDLGGEDRFDYRRLIGADRQP